VRNEVGYIQFISAFSVYTMPMMCDVGRTEIEPKHKNRHRAVAVLMR